MPQDKSSPTGRLILPQSQIMKELLDKECLVLSTGLETLEQSLQMMKKPDLVITDSKVFKEVDKILDKNIKLTSFSILFAKNKGAILLTNKEKLGQKAEQFIKDTKFNKSYVIGGEKSVSEDVINQLTSIIK